MLNVFLMSRQRAGACNVAHTERTLAPVLSGIPDAPVSALPVTAARAQTYATATKVDPACTPGTPGRWCLLCAEVCGSRGYRAAHKRQGQARRYELYVL